MPKEITKYNCNCWKMQYFCRFYPFYRLVYFPDDNRRPKGDTGELQRYAISMVLDI